MESTLAWLNWSRLLPKDYELLHTTAENVMWVTLPSLISSFEALPRFKTGSKEVSFTAAAVGGRSYANYAKDGRVGQELFALRLTRFHEIGK